MSEAGREARTDEIVRAEAIAWLTRLRSPDGAEDHETFQDWYAADPRHADIYDDVLGTWDRTALAALRALARPMSAPGAAACFACLARSSA